MASPASPSAPRAALPPLTAFLALVLVLGFATQGLTFRSASGIVTPLNMAMNLMTVILALRRVRQVPEEAAGWQWLSLSACLGMVQGGLFFLDSRLPGAVPPLVWFALSLLYQGTGLVAILSWPWRRRLSSRSLHHVLGAVLFCGSLLLVMGCLVNWGPALEKGRLVNAFFLTSSVRVCLYGGLGIYLVTERPVRWRGPLGWILVNALGGGVCSAILFAFWARGVNWLLGPLCGSALLAAFSLFLAVYTRHPVEPTASGPERPSPYWEALPSVTFLLAACTVVLHGFLRPRVYQLEVLALVGLMVPLLVRQFLLYKEVRRVNEDLEGRVQARTQELEAAHAAAMRIEDERFLLQGQLAQAQKLESLGSLAGGVAHDMNNVLGAILALATAHQEIQPEGSPARQAFDTISQAAARGGDLVGGLLRFARQSPAEWRELDLNGILRDSARLLERTTLAKVRLELDLAEGLRPMAGDASALSHAVMNLCVNAVDAMKEEGTLVLRTRNLEAGWLGVEVADTGCGMPKAVLDKALDPFFTTKPTGKGTGLGLSLVYSTVRAHQGTLTITSEPGQGTQVAMRFPAHAPATVAPVPDVPERMAQRPLRVLLVDDDDLVRRSMVTMMAFLGHRLTVAVSGEEALFSLQEGLVPEVVILDLNMPGLGGARTLAGLRGVCPGVPVLLATGRADQAALDLVEAYEGVALMAKPFSMADLRSQLGRI